MARNLAGVLLRRPYKFGKNLDILRDKRFNGHRDQATQTRIATPGSQAKELYMPLVSSLAQPLHHTPSAESDIVRKTLSFPGPAGKLQAILSEPESDPALVTHAVAVCHPHPLHSGTMHNKVVHYLAKTFADQGAAALRFNYRGVGESEGNYDEGQGETDDVLAALDWLRNRYPQARLWLAGFSFGAYTSLRASSLRDVAGLVSVAPPVHLFDMTQLPLPKCPWLVVQGDQDMVVSYSAVRQWLAHLPIAPRFVPLEGIGHFFHGKLNVLQTVVGEFIREHGVQT